MIKQQWVAVLQNHLIIHTSIVEYQSFVYDTSLFSETLATKLDLVCKLYVNYYLTAHA